MRLFQESIRRNMRTLDGVWQFALDGSNCGQEEQWYASFPKDAIRTYVPSCWNTMHGLLHYEGVAWYQTEFYTTAQNLKLVFGAVQNECDVYMDGRHICSHYGGFVEFSTTLRGIAAGKHTLTLRVSNIHNSQNTIPLSKVDWFHHGGIARSVELIEFGEAWIDSLKLDYTLTDSLHTANLSARIRLCADRPVSDVLKLYVNDTLVCEKQVEAAGETDVLLDGITLQGIRLWDVLQPNLYLVRAEFAGDDMADRIGFRTVSLKDGRICVNDKPVKLKGVNRHEEHPDWGFAMPFHLIQKDIDIIKGMGCNMVRGSHYPNSKATLDYLDETGLLFWEEIPMWGFPEHALKDPLVTERGRKMHTEMVLRDYHHPCIILWGLHNEIDTRTDAAVAVTKAFSDTVRTLDDTRLVTYATMYPLEDRCFAFADVISVNKYFGWYHGPYTEWDAYLEQLDARKAETGNAQKPLLISEFGAGAIFGERAMDDTLWGENYQDKCLDYTLNLFLDSPLVAGMCIWQYCDMRTAPEVTLSRPRGFNNKGVLNENRKPKQAYATVKKIYSSADARGKR